ncbi:MAG TPA: T9SS type A sorting domain-containing protein [Chitinophagales bacterium]|nr:T9SS type A sorting domain-containing protein [Chitinophagales bacterium]
MKKILLLLSLAPLFITAQTLDPYAFYVTGYDGIGVNIQPGALLHIQGDLTNTDAGMINNGGVIELKGNFDNTGAVQFQPMGVGNEKVVKFIGDGTQVIKGDFSSPLTNSFYNLVIDKSTSNSAVELQTNVQIDGSLVFGTATTGASTYTPTLGANYTDNANKGVIRTYTGSSDYELYVANPDVEAIKGYPALGINSGAVQTNSYVQTRGARGVGQGGLSRSVGSTGVNYVYPVGTATNGYQAVRFNFNALGGGDNKIRGLFCDGTDNPSGYVGKMSTNCVGCGGYYPTPDNQGVNILFGTSYDPNPCNPGVQRWVILEQAIRDHGYWSFEGDPSNQYSMESFPQSFTEEGMVDNSNYFETWRTLKYSTPIGDNPSQATDDWTSQVYSSVTSMDDLITFTRNAGCYDHTQPGVPGGRYTGFSHFMVSHSKSNNALPVELIYLKAEPVNNQFIQVAWATSVEINNRGFEVLRSVDGMNFTNIGWVDGHNNSTTNHTYTFDDTDVSPNVIYYYKLRQVDNDNHSEETYIVNAMITSGDVFSISEFIPNPAKDASRIVVTTSVAQDIDVKVFDMLGRELSRASHTLTAGDNTIYFDTNILADATYTAVITANNKVYSKKLVIAHR